MITAKTVNLSQLALHCHYKSRRKEASYRRLQRVMERLSIPLEKSATFILSLVPGPYLLALDRTNWNFGKTPINILMLSVVWRGQAIPLFWTLLPHKGCSAPRDRIHLMDAFLKLKGADCLQSLTMDREFMGKEWLDYLDKRGVTFQVRLRNSIKLGPAKGELVSPKQILNTLKNHDILQLPGRRRVGARKEGMRLFICATRSSEDELVVIYQVQKTRPEGHFLLPIRTRCACYRVSMLKKTTPLSPF